MRLRVYSLGFIGNVLLWQALNTEQGREASMMESGGRSLGKGNVQFFKSENERGDRKKMSPIP